MENEANKYTIEYNLFTLNKQFMQSRNLYNHIQQCVDFYYGKHFPEANKNNNIRVVMNVCQLSVKTKASKICGTPIYFGFTADNNAADTTKLRQFDEYNCKKMHLENSNRIAAKNGYVKGSEVTFIRWDEDDTSYKGIYKGGLVEEHIDPRNFAVANPCVKDIQNQEWVMFWENYPVGAIKELVEGKTKEEIEAKKELIERESAHEGETIDKESINRSLVRVFTRFFRIKGEVYFNCSTDKVTLFAYPHPLSKTVSKAIIKGVVEDYTNRIKSSEKNENGDLIEDFEIDYQDIVMAHTSKEKFTDKEYAEVKEKFSLYPFAVWTPEPADDLVFGYSSIHQLIPSQKLINFTYSMLGRCVENTAYGKFVVKPETLRNQKITNEPGQVITDYSGFNNSWGIKTLESQPLPNGLTAFVENFVGMIRDVYSFSPVLDGTMDASQMSGYLYNQMNKEANTSIEQEQKTFWLYNEEKAAIRLMYYKHYVDKARYTYELDDATYESEEEARKIQYKILRSGGTLPKYPEAVPEDFETPTHKVKTVEIDLKDYVGRSIDIAIDAMQGLAESEFTEAQMWETLLTNGGFQNIDPDNLAMWLESAPNVSPRFKTAINRIIEKRKKTKTALLEQKIAEMQQEMARVSQYVNGLEASLGFQSKYNKNLTAEFKGKVDQLNKINLGLMHDLQKKEEGEIKSNNAKGIEGGDIQNISQE